MLLAGEAYPGDYRSKTMTLNMERCTAELRLCPQELPVHVTINADEIRRSVVVLGASAGGIQAVRTLLQRLPKGLPAIVGVAIHRGAHHQSDWSPILGAETEMHVSEASDGEVLRFGRVYIAPPDQHLTFAEGKVALSRGPKEHHTRPAADPLFESAANAYGRHVVGIVLTGAGHDGALGLISIAEAGGICLVQAGPEHARMPQNAIERDHVCASLNVEMLGDLIPDLAHGRRVVVDQPRECAIQA